MQRFITSVLVTTALSLIILAVIVVIAFPGFDLYFSYTVRLTLGVNTIIHLGMLVTRKFESKYLILEVLLDITFIIAVLMIFGYIYDVFYVIPVFLLAGMGLLVHVFALFMNMARVAKDVSAINELIKKREKTRRAQRKERRQEQKREQEERQAATQINEGHQEQDQKQSQEQSQDQDQDEIHDNEQHQE